MTKRPLALVFLSGIVVGCTSGAVDGAAPVDVDDGIAPSASIDPGIVLCLPPAADVTLTLPNASTRQATGQADINDSCDWFVVALTDTLGGDAAFRVTAENFQSQGITISSERSCVASTMTVSARGRRLDGTWESIESFEESGRWESGFCGFPAFMQGYVIRGDGPGPFYPHSDLPYTKVEIRTRTRLFSSAGKISSPLRVRADRYDNSY
jgi:hypothetical protein